MQIKLFSIPDEKRKILKDVKEAYQSMIKGWDNAGKKNTLIEKKTYWNE